MSSDVLPLILGTLLALGALSFVLSPLLSASVPAHHANDRHSATPGAHTPGVATPGVATPGVATPGVPTPAVPTPAVPTPAVPSAARRNPVPDPVDPVDPLDPVEAAVRAADARRPRCAHCGPRPESDAVYCSDCGSYLPGRCPHCDVEVTLPASRFCLDCGGPLSASA